MEHLFGLTGDERSDDEGKNHKFEKSHEELPGIGDVDDGERVQVVRSEQNSCIRLAHLLLMQIYIPTNS